MARLLAAVVKEAFNGSCGLTCGRVQYKAHNRVHNSSRNGPAISLTLAIQSMLVFLDLSHTLSEQR